MAKCNQLTSLPFKGLTTGVKNSHKLNVVMVQWRTVQVVVSCARNNGTLEQLVLWHICGRI